MPSFARRLVWQSASEAPGKWLVACNPKPLLSSILNYFKGRHTPQAEHASVNVYFPPAVAVFPLSRWLLVLAKIERLAPTVQTQTMPLGLLFSCFLFFRCF